MTLPTEREIAEPLLAPLADAARQLGLEVRQPRVLGVGANVVVHLAPSPVVARVATLTAEMRTTSGTAISYFQRERDITTALSKNGHNTIAPTAVVDPGPHDVDGLQFLLLQYRALEPLDLSSKEHAVLAARAFVELSEALAGLEQGTGSSGFDSDRGHPWNEINMLLRTVRDATDPVALTRIMDVLGQLRDAEPDEPQQLVHGDAHRVNVAFSDGEIVWIDFEEANYRPQTWDLATLRRSWPDAGEEACRLLGVDPNSSSMRWHFELREIYALLWSQLMSQRLVRARRPAATRLAEWMKAH